MPLIKDGRFSSDEWVRLAVEEPMPASPAKLLLSLGDFRQRGAAVAEIGHDIGIEISNEVDPEALVPAFERLKLIAVDFPKAADGRGYSIATRLRRLGYKGELRASGYLIADQYVLARNCGFDTVQIPDALAERQPEAHWIEVQRSMTFAYQRGYGEMQNIVTARWAKSI